MLWDTMTNSKQSHTCLKKENLLLVNEFQWCGKTTDASENFRDCSRN